DELASVEMHAIQTSGNCIRNITSDPFAGVAPDEIEDPRPWCELLRQWSTFHPEFAYLPRKFKIALTGTPSHDRAAIRFHDIGIRILDNAEGTRGFEIWVGGGMGRTPFIGTMIRPFIEYTELLAYPESILRVYNLFGRRDNKHKARIKILDDELGAVEFTRPVEEDFARTRNPELRLERSDLDRIAAIVRPPAYESESGSRCDADLSDLYDHLVDLKMATPSYRLLSDIIACPGLDYCALANARSIPLSLELSRRFDDIDYQEDVGPCSIKISGCINACGHHHV